MLFSPVKGPSSKSSSSKSSVVLHPPIRCLLFDATTTTIAREQLPPRLVRLVKRALLLVASAKCNGETESKSIRRLGEFIREKRGKEKEDKEEDKVLSFLETQMTKRRGTPTAKSLLRLTCIQKEEEEEEDEERRTAATTTSHSSTAGKKEERKRREELYFMEWRSAFYEQLWMEERKLREEKIVLAKKATTSLMSSSAVLSPDGPLSMMGDEYARTPSTAGKTSASSVDDEEDDGEDNTARSGSKCDYRDWNAITRSPISSGVLFFSFLVDFILGLLSQDNPISQYLLGFFGFNWPVSMD